MKKLEFRILIILIIVHLVGIAGLLSDELRPITLKTTPFVILLGFLVSLALQPKFNFKLLVLLMIVGVSGFFIEYAGVVTGWIFGNYKYGKTLGMGYNGIPFIIGVNWAALVFYTSQIQFGKFKGIMVPSMLAALLMTLFDIALEPNAIRYDFWSWEGNTIPIQNYIAWFIISCVFHLIIKLSKVGIKPGFGRWVLAIQFAFFSLLVVFNYLL